MSDCFNNMSDCLFTNNNWLGDNFMMIVIGTVIFFVIILFALRIFTPLKKVPDQDCKTVPDRNRKCSIALLVITIILVIASFFVLQIINPETGNQVKKEVVKNSTEKPVTNEKYVTEKTTQNELATKIVEKTALLSAITFIVVFVGFFVYALGCTKKPNTETGKSKFYSALLTRLLVVSLSSSTIPTGISLILCVLFGIQIDKMTGLEVYLIYAGSSLIFMTGIVLREEKKRIDDLWKDEEKQRLDDLRKSPDNNSKN